MKTKIKLKKFLEKNEWWFEPLIISIITLFIITLLILVFRDLIKSLIGVCKLK